MKKNIIKVVLFLAILLLIGNAFSKVLCFKYADGIQSMEYFYKEPRNSIDVLCVGSSHMFCNINTKTFWEEFGISSYDLGGSVQPVWNSYFFLKEAFSYQKPKVVVFEVYRAVENRNYVDHSRIVKNTFGIASLYNRVEAIRTSSDKSMRPHYLLAFPTYHQRYNEIGKANFIPQDGAENVDNEKGMLYSKGFFLFTATKPQETEGIYTESVKSLAEKTEKYIYKIIDLCKENDVPLIFVVTPYAGDSKRDESYYARVAEIANDNDIPFVNFNHIREKIGIDYSTDAADSSHLNHRGSMKFTNYLGNYLKEHYELPDHRGEAGYASYDAMCQFLQHKIDNQELQESKELDGVLECVINGINRYVTIISLQGDYDFVRKNEKICTQLERLGISVESLGKNNIWVIDGNMDQFHGGEEEVFDWHMLLKDGFIRVVRNKQTQSIECNINREQQMLISNGLSIVVYDKEMDCITDRAGFVFEDGKLGEKKILDTKLK